MAMPAPQSEKQKKASLLFLENIDAVRLTAFCCAPARHLLGDIINDSYIDFVTKAEKWDLEADVKPLLRKVTRNIALQYWHEHRKSLPEALGRLADRIQARSADDEQRELDRSRELKLLALCLEDISEEHRQILESHYIHGISIVKLAHTLKKNVNALYSFFTRLRNAIRECIESKRKGGSFDVEL